MTYPRMSCKDCKNRTPTCHCTCEEYKTYKQELEAFKADRDKERIMNEYIRDNAKKRRWSK